MLREAKHRYADMSGAWAKLCEARDKVFSGIQEAAPVVGPNAEAEVPTDITQATLALDKVRRALDVLRKAKSSLDVMDGKTQLLSRLGQEMPGSLFWTIFAVGVFSK